MALCRDSNTSLLGSHAGWSKFYPKGKAKRPQGEKGPKDDKSSGDANDLGQALTKGVGGQLLLFGAALTLAFSLMNMGRSDAQVRSTKLTSSLPGTAGTPFLMQFPESWR